MSKRRRQRVGSAELWPLLAGASYVLLALLLVAPVLPVFTAAIPGGPIAGADGWQNVWNLWWVERAVTAGRNPFVTDMLFYPEGVALYLQTLGVVNGLLALPATATWGPVAGYNLALIASLALSGLAAYALALHVCREPWVAALAGALFLALPYLQTRVYDGQLELVGLHWPVLYALFLLRTAERQRRRDGVVAGVLLALTGLASWYYLLFMGLYSLGFLLLWLPRERAALRPLARALLALGVTASVLLLPVLGPAFATSVGDDVFRPAQEEVAWRSANLLDFWLPSYVHPLWGQQLFAYVGARWQANRGDWNVALGYSTLGLALLGLARHPSLSWRWLVLAGLFLVLSLGPVLQIGVWRTGLPLPYALLAELPGLSAGRRPALFVSVAALALIPPVALGLKAFGALVAQTGRRWLWAALIALVAFELAPRPLPLHHAAVHPIYAEIARQPGAVLELPPAAYKHSEPQRAQLVHGRPILGGYLARQPRYAWPNDMPGLRPLWKMRPEDGDMFLAGSDGPLAALSAYGIGAVVVRWDQIAPERTEAVRLALAQALPGLAPAYADATLSLYRLPTAGTHPIAALSGDGWGREEHDSAGSWRWMGAEADLTLINPETTPRRVAVSLAASSLRSSRDVALSLNGEPVGSWRVAPELTRVRLWLWLPPGTHRLTLRAPTAPEHGDGSGRELSIALREATLDVREP